MICGRQEADWVEVPETMQQLLMEGYVDQLAMATDLMWGVACKTSDGGGGGGSHPPSYEQVRVGS